MYCSQCQGIEEMFSQEYVRREVRRYRRKGPGKTTRMLMEAIEKEGVEGLSLLDIGGGVGAIQHELIEAGVQKVTSVDASAAYLNAAREEAKRRGQADRVTYHQGNFADLADEIAPADIVTLDRVICCYPDMEQLVGLSAKRAQNLYGLVYPRDSWWIKTGLRIGNLFLRWRGSSYRAYVHSSQSVEALISSMGLKRRSYRKTLVWQVVVYTR